jgi:hypothetical protein
MLIECKLSNQNRSVELKLNIIKLGPIIGLQNFLKIFE